MSSSSSDSPPWLEEACRRWKSRTDGPAEGKWTGYWIEKFLGYLRSRNNGKLPISAPSVGVVDSFCRFIAVEQWKETQAREALEWFAGAAGFGEPRVANGLEEMSRRERRTGVELPVADLPLPQVLDARLKFAFGTWADATVSECRRAGHSIRTEKTYESWCRRFSEWWLEVGSASVAAPAEGELCSCLETAVVAFMDHLAVERSVGAATQRQALNAVAFLVVKVLGLEGLDFVFLRFAALRCRRIRCSVRTSCEGGLSEIFRWS